MTQLIKRVAIVGGGPSALFLLKAFLENDNTNFIIDIFEAGNQTGSGFPYSRDGSCYEHITNVSGNEIPELVTKPGDWLKTLPPAFIKKFEFDLSKFDDYHVFPRLLFGEYLHAQFGLLLKKAAGNNIIVRVHLKCRVTDIADDTINKKVSIRAGNQLYEGFDHVVICSGHQWSLTHEGNQAGYYDSPYPPVKIAKFFNHAIAIKGSSLTAIDAIRTLALHNGQFTRNEQNQLVFTANEKSKEFFIDLYSLQGLLPGIRFHLEDPHLSTDSLLTEEDLKAQRSENNGFIPLDFIFEKDFKEPLRTRDLTFYQHIKDMTLEAFVDEMMKIREQADPFQLLRAEYEEARLSIKRKQSVHWKELLAVLSFAMNYPAKYFSAEDMLRLQKTLMPLISIIIAFVPQDSCEELFALHDAGKIRVIPVEKESYVTLQPEQGIIYHFKDASGKLKEIPYKTFIDCTGQKHLWLKDFPFKRLIEDGTVSQALLSFLSTEKAREAEKDNPEKITTDGNQNYHLKVPGIAISDCFEVIGTDKKHNPRIYMMAVPFIGGYNPDYSGLDFCVEASRKIVPAILQ